MGIAVPGHRISGEGTMRAFAPHQAQETRRITAQADVSPSAKPHVIPRLRPSRVPAVTGGSGGQSLAPPVRLDMETRFGADFSDVRIYTDTQAAESAATMTARAYTVGSAIVFGQGSFEPGSLDGKRLLAHELAHVLQQRKGPVPGADTGIGVAVSDPSDPCEQEAEASASRVMTGPRSTVGSSSREGGSSVADQTSSVVQRACACGGSCASCKETEDLGNIQALPRVALTQPDLWSLAPTVTIMRQVAISGGPSGPDGCSKLLQEIAELLNEVAQRFNNALDDRHELYKYYRKDPHPDYGSWEGHKDRYYYDRDRLREKLAEWEADDNCRGFPLSDSQRQDLSEAEEFAHKEFPDHPAPSMSRSQETVEEHSVWDTLRKYLPEIVVGALIAAGSIAVGAALVACFASGACEFALALAGVAAGLALIITAALKAAGVQDASSNNTPIAVVDQKEESAAS
jgi:hypothetical protein